MTISRRIIEISKHYGLNQTAFARSLGYDQPQKIARLFNYPDQANPSAEVLIDIANNYPDVSLRWLITGKNSMFAPENEYKHVYTTELNEPATAYGSKDNLNILELIEFLKQALNDKEKIIKLLEEKLAARR